MSTIIYRRGYPHNYLSEYVHKDISKVFPQTNKYLCFENNFSYVENACVKESVRTRGMGHVDIQVWICMIYLNVCLVVIT